MKTDLQLKKEVTEELDWDPAIDAAAIGVEVRKGVVTLSGHLPSYAEKLAAEHAAEKVSGVRAVVVNLDVRPMGEFSDEAIGSAARGALQWHVHLPADAVKLRVEKGHVTLTGEVEWGYQRTLAERTVSQLRGVTGVTNQIRIQVRPAPANVVERIEAALRRHAEREAKHISVAMRDGTVTLSGRVDSRAERLAAVGAAWSAPGVGAVVDDLELF
ncbi:MULTISPECIES: BON domain-containing protein [unclassified Cupriavidus]|uniref:BON domain-containing protein n=1 Tax=unclassified Cupriavidus TaxID=2640874 RepID=UPI001AE69F32|nr:MULTISPECIES: BON domain-containing protein [unclassified Cupriavidus]MBP0632843.1 BON domain-containing protein [Cupriavidus sp. AcVe19-1a]MBP0639189.1 BON domain-containing protein [Cupriavidus sp. AcVe19-6a]